MKFFLIFLIFFTYACNKPNISNNINDNYSFSKNMSFDEFKIKLNEYANNSPYPNLND